MKKAISYIRLSSQDQIKGLGLSRQLEITQNYAKKNGLKLIDNLRDLGLSGFKGHHTEKGELGQFMKALQEGEIDNDIVLLVESLDRLSRQSPLTAFKQFTDILQYGIEIHTILDNQIYTKESVEKNQSQLFISIGSMIRAHEESRIKSDRLSAAWNKKREMIREGKIFTKNVPAWIEIDYKKNEFKLKPMETKILQDIFNLSIYQDMGIYSITKYLNENLEKYTKFTTHFNTKEWGQSYIKKLLTSSTVYGAITLKKKDEDDEIIEDYYPAAISKETFLMNRQIMKDRTVAVGGKGNTVSNLFKGILKCNNCGGNIIHRRKTEKDEYLSCTNKLQHRLNCKTLNWNYKDFEKSFFESVMELNIEEIFKKPNSNKKKIELKKSLLSKKNEFENKSKEKDVLISRLAIVDDELISIVQNDLKKRIFEIKILDDEIKEIDLELMNLNKSVTKNTHLGLIKGWKNFTSEINKSEDEIKQIRSRMSSMIRDIIESITIVNNPYMLPEIYDIDDLDTKFIQKYWKTRSERTKFKDFNDFISSDYGTKKLAEWERHYIVKFKNGEIRYVQPSKGSFLFKNIKNEFLKHKK